MSLVRGALVALCLALFAGLLAAVYTLPAGAAVLEPLGLDMRAIRPLHAVFGAAWIALAVLAVVTRGLRGPGLRFVTGCFAVAGLGIAVTLPMGLWSGREYVGFHPIWALPIAAGWIGACVVVARRLLSDLWNQPVHVLMWVSGLGLFLFTFAEQYAWLIPQVFADPIVDRRIQWKACGTLVGALNFLVYGCVVWLGAQLGDRGYGRSRTAWTLWYLAVANSFLNYIHHTYHLPQSHGLKWLGFLVSMTEVVVLVKAIHDIGKLEPEDDACRCFLNAAKGWSVFVLGSSILLAIPPLNSLVHGTYLVPGHAMAGMVGLDTMLMLAVLSFMLRAEAPGACPWIRFTNVALFGMVGWLHAVGIVDGVTRFLDPGPGFSHRPEWLADSLAPVLMTAGAAVFIGFSRVLPHLLRPAFARHTVCTGVTHEEAARSPDVPGGAPLRRQ